MKRKPNSQSFKQRRNTSSATRQLNNNNNVYVVYPNQYQSQFETRKWLIKRGKQDVIVFKDKQIQQLRKYFAQLDQDGSGSIGVKELQDPLIALGLSQSREQIVKMIEEVDQDGSGMIEFNQFLSIIARATHKKKGKTQQQGSSAIHDFFKSNQQLADMCQGQLSDQMDKNIPFKLNVSQYRRRKIMEAIMADKNGKQIDKKEKEKANKILQSFKKHILLVQQQSGKMPQNDERTYQILNAKNGFSKYNKIMKQSGNSLIKPESKNVQKLKI